MKWSHRWLTLSVVVVLMLSGIPLANAGVTSITVVASPQTIRADGSSTAQVSAQIPGAPDGTEVRFITSAGTITPVIHTQGGVATAILISSATPSVALVTATAGGVSGSTQVEFVESEMNEVRASRTIKVEAAEILYNADQEQIFAYENAVLDYQGLRITADSIQFDQPQRVIKAQGAVMLTRGKKSLQGEDMVFYPSNNRGIIVQIGSKIETLTFQGDSLEALPSKFSIGSLELAAITPAKTRVSVRSTKMIIFPGEKIQFSHAVVMVDDSPVIKLPNYIVSLTGRGQSLVEQQIRYTSSEGLVLDLPFYFGVTERSASAFKLRYASSGSNYSDSYRPRKGISLGFQQDYSLGIGGTGRFMVDSILQNDRRFDFTHRQEFMGGTRADLSLSFQPTTDYSKNVFNGYASLIKPLGQYQLSLTASQSSYTRIDNDTQSSSDSTDSHYQNPNVKMNLRRLERRIGKLPLSYGADLTAGYGKAYKVKKEDGADSSDDVVRDYYQGIGMTLRPSTWAITKSTRFSSNIRGDYTRFVNGLTGSRVGTNLTLSQSFGPSTTFSVGYSYNLQNGSLGGSYSPSTQNFNASLYSSMGRFSSSLNFYYGLGGTRSMYANADASYQLSRTWDLRMQSTLSKSWYLLQEDDGTNYFDDSSPYKYLQFGVGKSFGNYEVSLNWSPQGRDAFGVGGSNAKFWLEFGTNSIVPGTR